MRILEVGLCMYICTLLLCRMLKSYRDNPIFNVYVIFGKVMQSIFARSRACTSILSKEFDL